MSGHVHQWKRWPVVEFHFSYNCAECGEPGITFWTEANAGRSIAEIDAEFAASHGGVYAGEWVRQPSHEENMRRLAQMMGEGPGTIPFTCPCCGAVSHHPQDAEHGYCGRCHWWTADLVLGPPHLEAPCPARAAPLRRS